MRARAPLERLSRDVARVADDMIELRPVPPPGAAPVDAAASKLGLVPGLRAELQPDSFRCSNCSRFVVKPIAGVWVPDSVSIWDGTEGVTEQCRLNARNGHHSF